MKKKRSWSKSSTEFTTTGPSKSKWGKIWNTVYLKWSLTSKGSSKKRKRPGDSSSINSRKFKSRKNTSCRPLPSSPMPRLPKNLLLSWVWRWTTEPKDPRKLQISRITFPAAARERLKRYPKLTEIQALSESETSINHQWPCFQWSSKSRRCETISSQWKSIEFDR